MSNKTIINPDMIFQFNTNHMYLHSKCVNENIDKNIIIDLSSILYNAYLKSNDIPFNSTIQSGLSVITEKYSVQTNLLSKNNLSFINNIFNTIILDYNKRRNING